MIITDVRVRKVYPNGKMKGIVSITLDDEFVIHDIKVIEGQNGFFVAMPSRKTPEGDFKDICHPISSVVRQKMQEVIFAAYEKAVEEMKQAQDDSEKIDLEVDYED